jgi:hypothetical protein
LGCRFFVLWSGVVGEESKALQGEIVLKGDDLTQEMIEADPERYQVLPNGAIYDHAIKRIVKAPAINTINRENARELINLRWQRAREAAAAGMTEAAASIAGVSPSNVTEYDAYSMMTGNLARMAMQNNDRSAVEAFRAVSQAAGLVPDKQSGGGGDAPALQINVSGDALARLLQLMQGIDSE